MPAEVTAYIGLGSNLGDPPQQLDRAFEELSRLPQSSRLRTSPRYRSLAVGPGSQPDYLNAVAEIRTGLGAGELLGHLHRIEAAAGRERGERWGPRTLDLDLLLYGNVVLDSAELQLPHQMISERNFVVFPLFDLAPALVLPDGTTVAGLRHRLGRRGIERLAEVTLPDVGH